MARKPLSNVHDQGDTSDRIQFVQEVFSTITPHYDFLTHLLSLRRDIAWRRYAVKRMGPGKTRRLLDLATGTGDLAIQAALSISALQVIGLDLVSPMLFTAKAKISRRRLGERIHLVQGDALRLPFESDQFDVVSMAFGIRNIPDKISALREMRRVLIPGGRVLVLETTLPQNPLIVRFYRVYLLHLLPKIAAVFSDYPDAYHYLGDSITDFPRPAEFLNLMADAGFIRTKVHAMTFGIAHLYTGRKQ